MAMAAEQPDARHALPRMPSQKRYHYIPQASQRLFSDPSGRIAYLPSRGSGPQACFVGIMSWACDGAGWR